MSAPGYSVDELRVLCRLAGAALPSALHPGWSDDDLPVADVVAARALVARGALTLDGAGGDPRPTATVAGLLAPVRDADTVVEILRVDRTGEERREVLAGCEVKPAVSVAFTEREPDVWEVRTLPVNARTAGLDRIGDLLDELAAADARPPIGTPVPAWGWPADEDLRAADDAAWRAALATLAARYLVRTARRRGPERWELGEVRLLDTGAGLWRCRPGGDDPAADWSVAPTTPDAVRADLTDLLSANGEDQ